MLTRMLYVRIFADINVYVHMYVTYVLGLHICTFNVLQHSLKTIILVGHKKKKKKKSETPLFSPRFQLSVYLSEKRLYC